MIITLTDFTYTGLSGALLASRSGNRQAKLTHTRAEIVTQCRGFHINGEYTSLIMSASGNYILIEAGDIITYDNGQ